MVIMSKELTSSDVAKLAQLARLRFSEADIKKYQKDINAILEYIELLDAVDVAGLQPTLQVTGLKNVMRTDEVRDQLATADELMSVAPNKQSGYIKVGRMI